MRSMNWLMALFGGRTKTSRGGEETPRRRSGPYQPKRFRPGLDVLEDRMAPAVLTVNSTLDTASATDGYLSLRQAIAIVNSPALPGGLSSEITAQISGILHENGSDIIQFAPGLGSRTITLNGNQLTLSLPSTIAKITIDGGTSEITLDGNLMSRIFETNFGVEATFAGLKLQNGMVPGGGAPDLPAGPGGGIFNRGIMTINNCTLSNNFANDGTNGFPLGGGAIANIGVTTINNSTLSNNAARLFAGSGGIAWGGAIFSQDGYVPDGGTTTLNNCTLSGNTADHNGGAIATWGGKLTMTNCTVNGNRAFELGGALFVDPTVVTIFGCNFTDNSALLGGDLYNEDCEVTIIGSNLVDIVSSGGTVTNPIENLMDQVEELNLSSGQITSLTSMLEAAEQSLANDNTTAALNQFDAFVHLVNALVNGRRLGEITADSLIDDVESLVETLV